ncbi:MULTISPECIES: hypothetical protein [Rhodospirillales]|uniref:Uncharacterized protein n=2 Tax=Rhodospirillales TaxID=204441 RepID=B6IP10_RHOCS|nr:hypothetical protein [Rhodospirillum centenum]ACI99430.1 conserved hypothetical protein [Rhodospirillum centenum SW]
MPVRLSDPATLEAIRILADVLDEIAGPEKLECLMAANALRQVLETQSETALNFARQAFESLDPQVRRQIQTDATDSAVRVMQETRKARASGAMPKRPPGPSSPFLDAINSGGMKTERKW